MPTEDLWYLSPTAGHEAHTKEWFVFPVRFPWREQASFVNAYPLEIIFHLEMGFVSTDLLGLNLVQILAGPMNAVSFSVSSYVYQSYCV